MAVKVFRSLDIAGSSLTAHRFWMDTIAGNLANVNTTRTPEGGPYVRRIPIFQERLEVALSSKTRDEDGRLIESKVKAWNRESGSGVRVVDVAKDPLPPRLVYQPDHPDANDEGYVEFPNVNVVREMADLMVATRAYEASTAVVETGKAMWNSGLSIMRGNG